MNKRRINSFVAMSEKVSNTNEILPKKDVEALLISGNDELAYVHLPSFNTVKPCAIDAAGIDTAVVEADYAIAETGSVVVDSSDEAIRFATSLAENLIVVVKASTVVNKLENVSKYMQEKMSEAAGYVAFITGASRTADIERVLTIGVHGPVTMKVIIVEDL